METDTHSGPAKDRALGKWLTSQSDDGGEVSIATALAVDLRTVIGEWVEAGSHSAQTLERMGEVAVRFARRLTATGRTGWSEVGEQDCVGFIEARIAGREPSVATLHFRRTTIRTVFRTLRHLGIVDGEPTVDLVLPSRGSGSTRPLTDDEITLLRTAAVTTGRDHGRNATVLALAEATAITSEIAFIRVVDLDSASHPTTVELPGNRRARPRTAALTDWGRRVIASRIETLDLSGRDRLAYTGTAKVEEISGQASVCNALGVMLATTGLNLEDDVRPASARYWAARSMFDQGAAITDVANALGARSLDATAAAIGLDWQVQE